MDALVRELLAANPGVSEEQIWHYLQLRCREYDTSFRSPLTSAHPGVSNQLRLVSRCHCGSCKLQCDFEDAKGLKPIRCYCSNCRHFHSSSFAAYLPAPVNWQTGGSLLQVHQSDSCGFLGPVERFMCGNCYTRLGIRGVSGRKLSYLCLGSVEDDTIPDHLALEWQSTFDEWLPLSRPAWWDARPQRSSTPRRSETIRGYCSCKQCSFEASLIPGEAQHCYCKLCRRLSGSVAQTWVPASVDTFRWTNSKTLRLIRTTNHGQRHFCAACGTDMTIVYDSQPDCVWPAAGTLEDSDVFSQPGAWYRVIHICCSMMQKWYQLPDDDLDRLKYAG